MTFALEQLLHCDPWSQTFVDLPGLNRAATQRLEDMIHRTRVTTASAEGEYGAKSLVVLGPAGAGKTHIFARIRRAIGPRAVFVYVRPLIGSDMTPRHILLEVVKQLDRTSSDFSQLNALVGSALAFAGDGPTSMPRAHIEELQFLAPEVRAEHLAHVTEKLVGLFPHVDEVILQRLLATPFASPIDRRALLVWLSGREPDDSQLQRIGAREPMRNEMVLPALKTLGTVAAVGAPIVLVFDQLENLIDRQGSERIRSYGNLVSELIDQVPGLVVVQMCLDSEWKIAIEPNLSLSQRSRVASQIATLALPTAAELRDLLELWWERLPDRGPAFPAPATQEQISRLTGLPGVTPRLLLLEFSSALAGCLIPDLPDTSPETQIDALGFVWDRHVEASRQILDETAASLQCVEEHRVIDAIKLVATFVRNFSTQELTPNQATQLVVKHGSRPIHVAVLTKSNPRSLANTLQTLTEFAGHHDVLVIREKVHDFPPTWHTCIEKRQSFEELPNTRWVSLEREELARILALCTLLANARSGDLVNSDGALIDLDTVHGWVPEFLRPQYWEPFISIGKLATQPKSSSPDQPLQDTRDDLEPMIESSQGAAISVLLKLRIASVDRIAHEVRRMAPRYSRTHVRRELVAAGEQIQWFGRSIVAIREVRP